MARKKKTYRIPVESGDEQENISRAESKKASPNHASVNVNGNDGTSQDEMEKDTMGGIKDSKRASEETWQSSDAVRAGAGSADEEASPEEILDHLRRLQAEFANYRKRTERERLETGIWAQGQLVEKLLPALDDLDRATASLEEDDSPAAKGLAMIREKLFRILIEAGLERIKAAGTEFNPDVHEALMTQPAEADQVGMVLREMEPGYLFRGRLLRPARVQVGVAPEEGA